GLELGLSGNWNGLEVDENVISGGAVLFASGERLNFSPEYTLGVSADYSFPLGGSGFSGRIAASGNYTSAQSFRTIVGSNQSIGRGKDMFLARVSLALESAGHWNITLFADNVTNERDAVFGNPFAGVPLP